MEQAKVSFNRLIQGQVIAFPLKISYSLLQMATILLIEDDIVLSGVYEKKLQNDGYTVVKASDGEEGLKMALSIHPDLILLDVMLPKRDGLSVLHEVRQDTWGKSVPVVILSNISPSETDTESLKKDSPSLYLVKVDNNPKNVSEKISKLLKK